MAYTEFCCRLGGSNLNAGANTGGQTEPPTTPLVTYTSGSWVAATGVFTPASGDPTASGVQVGDWASVYADGATVTGFVGRVTAVSSTTITVSLTAKSGTIPTDGTGNRSLRIGGAWAGPSGSNGFPFNFIANTATQSTGLTPRVNLRNDQTYTITATIPSGNSGPLYFQGYTTTFGDGGRAVINGPTTGTAFTLLSMNIRSWLVDLEFAHNGNSGSTVDAVEGSFYHLHRVVVHDVWGGGIVSSGHIIECEAYHTNQGSFANVNGAITAVSGGLILRCVSHHNFGAAGAGFRMQGSNNVTVFSGCISHHNEGRGFWFLQAMGVMQNCDVYANGNHGLNISGAGNGFSHVVENSNFIANGGYGINAALGDRRGGYIRNCGFGTGTMANSSGDINTAGLGAMTAAGSIQYPADRTPWRDPDNNDFSLTLNQAKGVGYSPFPTPGYDATVGRPDVGAAVAQGTSRPVLSSPYLIGDLR